MASHSEKDFVDSLTTIRSEISVLSETIGRLLSDTAGIRSTLARTASSAANQAVAAGHDMISSMEGMASDAYGAAAKSATLLVALGIGLAIGFMGRK